MGDVHIAETKVNLAKTDEKHLWHAMKPYNPQSTMIVQKAEGAWLTDVEGVRYLDAMSGLWCVNVGYGREEIAKAAYDQLLENNYTPLTNSHPSAILLAEKISELLGGDYVVFFSNSGSEANETAFKMARQYFQQKNEGSRYKIVSRYRAYHGNTMGALAATGQAERKYKYEPLAPGFIHVKAPDQYRYNEDEFMRPSDLPSVQAVDEVMTWEHSETIAAMILEPIITGGGVIMPSDQYLKGVKEVCEKHGALLIVDEVICGFGRTGKAFGHQHYGVQPDIVTMAKGLTSAYMPLSATAVKREIYEEFMKNGSYDFFRHINTFGGSPAACAVALKNLEIMEREDLFEQSTKMGSIMINELKEKIGHHPFVGDIRGKGLLIGVELVKDRETKEPLPVDKVNQVIAECKNQRLIIGKNGVTVAGYNNVLTLSPPLNITLEEKDFILTRLIKAIETL
ncbi:aspartate aminotransferase family protein [Fictibacillus phosphorivorans]|uniref:aspartate aminotransferase family protein n=1 Tax=Fictibacillus phosphorivorans TaxID=1221500 RepID=UPI00203BCEEE|nr:aspartate aminotransferase family protein [Fictibacillus phosphorivorans]MCM3719826.1 aspartate aminotransferase family protein [Fictibacillus phosphorivorans]MCM3777503.1 aspartate aminotransferase family protein [Fictibacillus phosphorivorans]